MSQYPPQPPYNNQPDGNNPQQPYYNQPNQPPSWQQPTQYPYPQPGQQMPVQPQKKKRKSIKETWNSGKSGKCGILFAVGVLLIVVFACSGIMNAATSGSQSASTRAAATDTPVPTDTPQPIKASRPAGVVPVASHYPPKTRDDLNYLAAQGDVTAIHEFHSESTGLTGACPQPKREVTVDPATVGQKLAEDLLAYFYQTSLIVLVDRLSWRTTRNLRQTMCIRLAELILT